MALENDDREALIIRWHVLHLLSLIDYFSSESKFNKVIMKELIDMSEGVIKALAKSNGIRLYHNNGNWKGIQEIMDEIDAHPSISNSLKQKVRDINLELNSETLRDFRNNETHYLNLPEIPEVTVKRCCRLFDELVVEIDSGIFDYAKNRPELKDFYYLHDFFKSFVLDNKFVDLSKIKEHSKIIDGKKKGRHIYGVEISTERDIWEIINYIKEGREF